MEQTAHGKITSTSSAGARGVMQFMPATWATYGVDGDGDRRADITNNADSIHSAAHYLVRSGATLGPDGVRRALFAYNHAYCTSPTSSTTPRPTGRVASRAHPPDAPASSSGNRDRQIAAWSSARMGCVTAPR